MSIRSRMRSTIKWGGAVATVLLLIAWVGSWCMRLEAHSSNCIVQIRDGQVIVRLYSNMSGALRGSFVEFTQYELASKFKWWFEFKHGVAPVGKVVMVGVPIWFLALLPMALTVLTRKRDRKLKPNTCSSCGYNRTGLPHDRACPECGARPA